MTLAVDVLGTGVAVTAPPDVLAELRLALADLPPADSPERELALVPTAHGFDLCDDGRLVRGDIDPVVAAATVVWRLDGIAGESRSHVVLHAAAVTGPHGGAVLLPAGSGAGKSTLTAACLAAGLAYLSDELVPLDLRTGTVTPYPKPLLFDDGRLVAASTLGRVAAAAVPTAVVFPRYEPDSDLTDVRLDSGWALVALASHAANLAVLGERGLRLLAGLAQSCPALQVTYGDAGLAVRSVEQAASGPGRPVEPAEVLAPVTDATTAVAVDDGVVVLHEPSGRVHLLNDTAALVWQHAAGGRDADAVIDAALEARGGSGLDRQAVAATLGELVRAGLVSSEKVT